MEVVPDWVASNQGPAISTLGILKYAMVEKVHVEKAYLVLLPQEGKVSQVGMPR